MKASQTVRAVSMLTCCFPKKACYSLIGFFIIQHSSESVKPFDRIVDDFAELWYTGDIITPKRSIQPC